MTTLSVKISAATLMIAKMVKMVKILRMHPMKTRMEKMKKAKRRRMRVKMEACTVLTKKVRKMKTRKNLGAVPPPSRARKKKKIMSRTKKSFRCWWPASLSIRLAPWKTPARVSIT